MKPLTHASLFSGIGGVDLGAEAAGFTTCFQCEINPFAAISSPHASLTAPFTATFALSGGGDIIDACRGVPTVLSGGFPCQPVSLAGSRKGSNDTRWLWPEYLRLIRECKPKWIVAENVAALFHTKEWSDIYSDIQKEGYEISSFVLRAADAGAPHLRARAFVVAHSNSISGYEEDKTTNPIRDKTERREERARHNALWGFRGEISLPDWSFHPPRIHRVDDGFSRRLDKSRLQALGNAVVPRCVFPIFDAIRRIERGEC